MTRIVVVDDQPVLTSIYRAKFAAEGFQVDVAPDGEQALEVIERTRPDLVLLDLMLPKIKGVDVLRRLRANVLFKELPVVIFSNSAQPGAIEEAWAAGASMVLSKAKTSPKQMVESVISLLAKSGAAANDSLSDSESAPAMSGKSTRPAAPFGVRVLLVEGNPETRALISHLLAKAGQHVVDAEGPQHALLLSQTAAFDLALVNQAHCPDSVASFCRQIRAKHSDLPVIMYSMAATLTETGLHAGVSQYLGTPEALLNIAGICAALVERSKAA